MPKTKTGYDQKIKTVLEYINGRISQKQGAKKCNVSLASFQVWIRKYKSEGVEGLKETKRYKKYSAELKQSAVKEYTSGKASQEEICKKYKISSKSQLQLWIKWYNSHKEFKERRGAGTEIYMTKGRKTTLEERIEIVEYCIEHGKDYPATIKKYGISYQQIYSWVRKYEKTGIDGLRDGRGRTKPVEEMTDVERLQAENRLLRAQLRDKEVEMLLLKKLQELERGGR